MTARVSTHAKTKSRERLGLKPGSATRMAGIALQRGLKIEETSGSFRRYLDAKRLRHPGSYLRIYGEVLYIFAGEVLKTCWQLPPEYRATARKLRAGKETA